MTGRATIMDAVSGYWWFKAGRLILQILVIGLLIAIPILFIIFGETPVSYNGEPLERGGLVP